MYNIYVKRQQLFWLLELETGRFWKFS